MWPWAGHFALVRGSAFFIYKMGIKIQLFMLQVTEIALRIKSGVYFVWLQLWKIRKLVSFVYCGRFLWLLPLEPLCLSGWEVLWSFAFLPQEYPLCNPREMKTLVHTETCVQMFIVALHVVTPRWKQARDPSPDERMNRSGISTRWSVVQTCVTAGMNPENITLSGRSQSQKTALDSIRMKCPE